MSKPKITKTVTIHRKRWCRGNTTDSGLRTETGQSCCLGFVARACGLRTNKGDGNLSDLADQDMSGLPKALRPVADKDIGGFKDTPLHAELVAANDNDDPDVRGARREAVITSLMARAGIRAVFVD